jgi:hypothetical protein
MECFIWKLVGEGSPSNTTDCPDIPSRVRGGGGGHARSPFQLLLDQPLVGDGLHAVQHDQDQVARARRGNHLQPQPKSSAACWLQGATVEGMSTPLVIPCGPAPAATPSKSEKTTCHRVALAVRKGAKVAVLCSSSLACCQHWQLPLPLHGWGVQVPAGSGLAHRQDKGGPGQGEAGIMGVRQAPLHRAGAARPPRLPVGNQCLQKRSPASVVAQHAETSPTCRLEPTHGGQGRPKVTGGEAGPPAARGPCRLWPPR